jgi:hypothetical protein
MSEWTARITDHRVWKVMEGLGPKIDEAENVEGIEASAVESLERLRAVLAFCGKRLGATDPLTMTLAPVDAIATSFQTATTEVESFIKDKNFDHLTAANTSGADQALGYLAQVPGIATKQELVGLVQAANESRKAFEQHAKKSSESLKKAEGEIGELRKGLESTQSSITTLQGQIDTERQKITTQFSEQQKVFHWRSNRPESRIVPLRAICPGTLNALGRGHHLLTSKSTVPRLLLAEVRLICSSWQSTRRWLTVAGYIDCSILQYSFG